MISMLYFDAKINILNIWVFLAFFFPLVNLLIIGFLYFKTPKTFSGSTIVPLSSKEGQIFDQLLHEKRIPINFATLMKVVFLFSILSSILAAYFFGVFGLLILLLPPFTYFFFVYLNDYRNQEIEKNIPDALFQASISEGSIPMDKIIKNISRSDFGILSQEFSITSKQIELGRSVPDALENMKKRVSSDIFGRVIGLFNLCYKLGSNVQRILHETASDIFELNSVIKERQAIIAMQKYTVLYGGCLIVPVIIAITINIVSGLDFSYVQNFTKINSEQKSIMIQNIEQASQVYVALYVLLACIFVAYQEGRQSKFIVYALLFSFLAFSLFHFARENLKIM